MAEPGAADTSAQTASQLDETEKETKSEQVTIEPMMFLECMTTQISTIPREQMILYKICRGNSSHSH